VELRILKVPGKGTISGYYDDMNKLVEEASKWSGQAPGIYITLNEVDPALLSRALNRARVMGRDDKSTSDSDIIRRRIFPLDFDPVRPSGISSTAEENEAAIKMAKATQAWLSNACGWPKPVLFGLSGNGAHLPYSIDLPNDQESTLLMKKVLKVLDLKFSNEQVKVDLTTFNASRIWKLYGTMACKGDSTQERPHRMAEILECSEIVQTLTIHQLERVAALLPEAPKVNPNKSYNFNRDFDLSSWIIEHGLSVHKEATWQDGHIWVLGVCPFDSNHTDNSAYITKHSSGGIGAGCHHNGCKALGWGWKELRELYEPRHTAKQERADSTGSYAKKQDGLSIEPSPPELKMKKLNTEAPNSTDIYKQIRGQLEVEGYSINQSGGLCSIKLDKKNNTEVVVQISNFIAWVKRQIKKENGIESIMKFEIAGLASSGLPLNSVYVSSEKFNSMQWPLDAWGTKANIRPGNSSKENLRYVIQHLGKDAPIEYQYGHLGWKRIDAKWYYLHADGAVGNESIIVDVRDEGLTNYALPLGIDNLDNLQAAATLSLKTLDVAPLDVTLPIFAQIYLAPLCEALRLAMHEPSFVMWLSGLTGSMKSTLAALFLSHFGDFTNKNLPASFKDTANALERKGHFTKDSLLVVDDYHPHSSQNEAVKMRDIAERLLRGYGDRVGRSKLNSDSTAKKTLVPQGLCLVTGEDHPCGGQSAAARYFGIELEKGQVDNQLLTQLQGSTDFFRQAMKGYIQTLDINELSIILKHKFLILRAKASKEGQHLRLPEVCAWLMIGLESGLEYIQSTGVITESKKKELLEQGWEIFMRLAEKQTKTIEGETPVMKFRDALTELFANKTIHVNKVNEPKGINKDGFVGWHDDNWLYLLPGTVYNEVTKFYKVRGSHLPISDKILWKQLDMAGFLHTIEERSQKRHIIRKRFKGDRENIIQIKADFLDLDISAT